MAPKEEREQDLDRRLPKSSAPLLVALHSQETLASRARLPDDAEPIGYDDVPTLHC